MVGWFKSFNTLIVIELDQTSYPKYQFRILKYEDFGNYETLFVDGLFSSKEQSEIEAIKKGNEMNEQDRIPRILLVVMILLWIVAIIIYGPEST